MSDETEALRAEVAELRAEVARLREQLVAGSAYAVTATCTCGTSARCAVHAPPSWQGNIWITHPNTMGAAGCAGGAYTYTVPMDNTAGAPALTIGPPYYNTGGAAPVPQIVTYNTGGGDCA